MSSEAEKNLKDLRKSIIKSRPKKNEIPDHFTQLTPSADAKVIKYFPRINKKIKDEFRKSGQKISKEIIELEKDGPTGSGAETGKKWHTSIKKCIDNPAKKKDEIGKVVIDAVKKFLPEIEFLETEFPLYGYMVDREDREEISFWSGKVDTIGWYKDNYVIVDWKAVNLLDFWEKNRDAYGKYLHQCLVYAQLLTTHLRLPKLPNILIVPICNVSGRQIRPSLFGDFPRECKDELSKYEWSPTEPKQEKRCSLSRSMVEKIIADAKLVKKDERGELTRNLDGTVDALLKALFEE